MKIIVASDSFKGSLSSREVGHAAKKGILDALPDANVEVLDIADGGEGTTEAVVEALGGEYISLSVTGPLGEPIDARYGICGDTAVLEVAAACGLALVEPSRRNPEITTTYGVGEMILDALRRGCHRILIGLGGSATNDAGIGMLSALGYRFLDHEGLPVRQGALHVHRICRIDDSNVSLLLKDVQFTVACDVTNPLSGPEGASRVFAPQKGASPEMVDRLDAALSSLAAVVAAYNHIDKSGAPGAGAAGGLGFAFISFLKGNLRPGIEMVLDAVDFNHRIEGASLVITGEGRLDHQTLMGKTPYGVLRRAKALGIPVIAIGGAVVPETVTSLMDAGFTAVFPIVAGPTSLNEAIRSDIAAKNVERTVGQIIRTVKASNPVSCRGSHRL